jgi:hypothetical protein
MMTERGIPSIAFPEGLKKAIPSLGSRSPDLFMNFCAVKPQGQVKIGENKSR